MEDKSFVNYKKLAALYRDTEKFKQLMFSYILSDKRLFCSFVDECVMNGVPTDTAVKILKNLAKGR